MSSRLALWLRASRLPFLSASLTPALLGALAAYHGTGMLDGTGLVVTLAGVACIHLGANLANDYYDWKTGCDSRNPEPTPFSGGSRVIQEGLISPRVVMAAAAVCFALGAAAGVYLNAETPGNVVMVLGLLGLAGGFLYTAAPVSLSYRGLGEAVVFLCFGPPLVAGGYAVQAGRVDAVAVAASMPAGLLVLAVLLVNEVLDVEWDAEAGKRTLVVALGRERGYNLFVAVYVAAYAWVGLGIALRLYEPIAAVSVLPLLFSLRRLAPGRALRDRAGAVEASRVTVLSQGTTTGLLAISYLLPA